MYARRTRSFFVTRMRSNNSARINKSDFTTEKIVQCTHDSVQNCCSSQCCQLDTIIDMMYVVDQSKQCAQIHLQKKCMLPQIAITNTIFC